MIFKICHAFTLNSFDLVPKEAAVWYDWLSMFLVLSSDMKLAVDLEDEFKSRVLFALVDLGPEHCFSLELLGLLRISCLSLCRCLAFQVPWWMIVGTPIYRLWLML